MLRLARALGSAGPGPGGQRTELVCSLYTEAEDAEAGELGGGVGTGWRCKAGDGGELRADQALLDAEGCPVELLNDGFADPAFSYYEDD